MATRTSSQGQPVVSEVSTGAREEITALDREVGAAFIASGIGSFVLGLVIVLTEMPSGAGLKTFLTWVGPVGALSGKTSVAVIAFVASWVGLHFYFRNRPISLTRSFIIAIALIALGLLMSFPPVFELFAG
jgi:energy-converting hydrogenase Eha subunit A